MSTKSIIYIGKLFKLKKISNISWSSKPTHKPCGHDPDLKKGTVSRDEIPDQAMVLDERSKKVKVYLGKKNGYVWISKFYLGNEIVTNENRESCELLDKSIRQISNVLNKNVQRPMDEKMKLYEVLKNLRVVRENFK